MAAHPAADPLQQTSRFGLSQVLTSGSLRVHDGFDLESLASGITLMLAARMSPIGGYCLPLFFKNPLRFSDVQAARSRWFNYRWKVLTNPLLALYPLLDTPRFCKQALHSIAVEAINVRHIADATCVIQPGIYARGVVWAMLAATKRAPQIQTASPVVHSKGQDPR